MDTLKFTKILLEELISNFSKSCSKLCNVKCIPNNKPNKQNNYYNQLFSLVNLVLQPLTPITCIFESNSNSSFSKDLQQTQHLLIEHLSHKEKNV